MLPGMGYLASLSRSVIRKRRVTALDWANVLEWPRTTHVQAGVGSRYRTIAGSALEADYGGSYDLVLITNFLHHFGPAMCKSVLQLHAAWPMRAAWCWTLFPTRTASLHRLQPGSA